MFSYEGARRLLRTIRLQQITIFFELICTKSTRKTSFNIGKVLFQYHRATTINLNYKKLLIHDFQETKPFETIKIDERGNYFFIARLFSTKVIEPIRAMFP